MDIDDAVFIAIDEGGGENIEEACQHNQIGMQLLQCLQQCIGERFAAFICFAVDYISVDTSLGSPLQSESARSGGHNGCNFTADNFTARLRVQQSLEEAQKTLETAQENLDNCNAVAPIDGTVIGLSIQTGMEVQANTAVITIADTSTIVVDATVDERNISYVQPGMPVEIDQWGSIFYGVVDTVSLNSTAENGVARYPMVISVDNPDGSLMTGSYVNYTLTASENDNCLIVPLQCVKSVPLDDGSAANVLFVKADSRPENAIDLSTPVDGVPEGFWPVPVEIGISDEYNVEIRSGVEADTEVFTTAAMTQAW